jgi:hypothetical protein
VLAVLPRGRLGRLDQLCPRLPRLPPCPMAGLHPHPGRQRTHRSNAPIERRCVAIAQCAATANRTCARCQKRAIRGSNVCLSHGAAANQVRRVAAQRVALARAAELLGPDVHADPAEVLVAAVRSAAALLGAAQEAIRAEEADADALHQLGESALLAGRLAKLALDSGIEARLAREAERNGEVVGALLTRVLSGLDLGPAVTAKAFNLIRTEVESGHLNVGQLDSEIARLANELRESDYADAAQGFPAKLARAINAGFAVLDLDDTQQERVTVAVESFLRLEAEETARLAQDVVPRPASPGSWWVEQGRYPRNGVNGARR